MSESAVVGVRAEPAREERVPWRTKFFFGLGAAAETIGLAVIGGFAQFYYNQILGMSATLAGLAISAGLILDAISDPIMGSLSDRTRSRLGRRHPYMLLSIVPLGLSIWGVYHPPEHWQGAWLFAWFALLVISVRTFLTLFAVPRLALGGELSGHYTERTSVMSYNNLFGWIGGAGTAWVALSYFFHATPEHPNGMLNPDAYPAMATTAAIVMVVSMLLCSWFTLDHARAWMARENERRRAQAPPVAPPDPGVHPEPNASARGAARPQDANSRFGFATFFSDMKGAFTNRNYVVLLLAFFFVSCMLGMRGGMNVYVQNFFWEFKPEQTRMYVLGSLIGYITAFRFTRWLHERFDKRNVIVVGAAALAIVPAAPIIARLLGWLPGNDWEYLLPLLVGWSVIGAWGGAAANISVMSALAEVADENELRFGARQEGVIYATRSFFAKVDDAIGHVIAGVAIDLIAFPVKAIPGHVDPDIIWKLGFAEAVVSLIPGLIAVGFYSMYRMDRTRHAQLQVELERMRSGSG